MKKAIKLRWGVLGVPLCHGIPNVALLLMATFHYSLATAAIAWAGPAAVHSNTVCSPCIALTRVPKRYE